MDLRVKIWLAGEHDEGILGTGRCELLRAIGECGSLRQAAEQLGISYRKAWGDLRAAEERLGFALVSRRRGGSDGGACVLTERAVKLLSAYDKVVRDLEKAAQRQYERRLRQVL